MIKITIPSSISSWPTCWNSKHSFLAEWEGFKGCLDNWICVKYVWRLVREDDKVIAWVVWWLRSSILRLKSDCSVPWRFRSISFLVHETKESKSSCSSVEYMRSVYLWETDCTNPIIRIPDCIIPVLTSSENFKLDVTDSTVVRWWGNLDKLVNRFVKSPSIVWSKWSIIGQEYLILKIIIVFYQTFIKFVYSLTQLFNILRV